MVFENALSLIRSLRVDESSVAEQPTLAELRRLEERLIRLFRDSGNMLVYNLQTPGEWRAHRTYRLEVYRVHEGGGLAMLSSMSDRGTVSVQVGLTRGPERLSAEIDELYGELKPRKVSLE